MKLIENDFLRIGDFDLVSPFPPEIPEDDPWELELVELLEEDETVEDLVLEMHVMTLHNIEEVPPVILVEQWRQLEELEMNDPERMNLIREWAAVWPRPLGEQDRFLFPDGLNTRICGEEERNVELVLEEF